MVQPGADLSTSARGGFQAVQVGRRHARQPDQDRHVGEAVDEERGCDADGGDQDPCDRRPDETGGVERGAVEGDRVGDGVSPHHLGHERLARGVVDRRHAAERERDRVDHPELDPVEGDDGEEHERERACGGLGPQQGSALVEAVGDDASPDAEEQQREELERGREAERHTAAGQLQHQPALGDDLHPRAGERHELPGEEQAVVADAKGAEGATCDEAEAGHSAPSITRSRMRAALSNVASSEGVSDRRCDAR